MFMVAPFERFKRSMTNDNLWIYILTLLKKENLYAYQINEKIKKKFNFAPGGMTAYIILKRLQLNGYVKVADKNRDGGPQRTYYSITDSGKKELEKAKKFYKGMKKFF
jgi:PadR family transcriptional regulator, regulatory protein PadR